MRVRVVDTWVRRLRVSVFAFLILSYISRAFYVTLAHVFPCLNASPSVVLFCLSFVVGARGGCLPYTLLNVRSHRGLYICGTIPCIRVARKREKEKVINYNYDYPRLKKYIRLLEKEGNWPSLEKK